MKQIGKNLPRYEKEVYLKKSGRGPVFYDNQIPLNITKECIYYYILYTKEPYKIIVMLLKFSFFSSEKLVNIKGTDGVE